MKRLSVELDVWDYPGYVLVGGSSADFDAVLAFAYPEDTFDANPHAGGQAYIEEGRPWFIWIETPGDTETLVHEALHVTFHVLTSRGVRYSPKSEEAFTYTQDAIVRAVREATRKDWTKVQTRSAAAAKRQGAKTPRRSAR